MPRSPEQPTTETGLLKRVQGRVVAASEADVLRAAGQLANRRRRVRGGARVWKRHSPKAGSRCRCAACNAERLAGSGFQVPGVRDAAAGLAAPAAPQPAPVAERPRTAERPQGFAVRSTYMRS